VAENKGKPLRVWGQESPQSSAEMLCHWDGIRVADVEEFAGNGEGFRKINSGVMSVFLRNRRRVDGLTL
jgi:hypothetical protein